MVSRRGLEEKVLDEHGFSCRFVSLESVGRAGWFKMPYLMGKSLAESYKIVRKFNPDVLLGMGGFSSAPVTVVGKMLGKPVFVQEQNILPGLANRLISRFSKKAFISYAESDRYFPEGRTLLCGNPVRAGLKTKVKDYARFGFSRDRFTVMAFGGSQGAHKINKAMIESAGHLTDITDKIQILHITGKKDFQAVNDGYGDIKRYVTPYLMEMQHAYSVADLVICRSGATTLAEITALGKASVLVPYPHAAGDHQSKNADFLVHAGAAVKVADAVLDGECLAGIIRDFVDHPDKTERMGKRSAAIGTFEGAKKIIDYIMEELQDS